MKLRTLLIRVWRWLDLLRLAAIVTAGHRFWIWPFVPLLYVGVHSLLVYFDVFGSFGPSSVQGRLLGFPLACIGIFIGLRIIAGEISGRSIEIVYTVPGGAEKVWWVKLFAGLLILIPAEIILAVYTWFMITDFPLEALYGALQSGVFYMVAAMGFSTLFRSEVGGAIATVALGAMNGLLTQFGSNQSRWSPFFNPYAIDNQDPSTLLAWTLQNRVIMALVILAILGLAFMRGNRRERLLSA